jgi:pimeloyl-ACP methyl ester carboxylesterase
MTTHLVLVHGAWHGSWAFDALRHDLARTGMTTSTVDLSSVRHDESAGTDMSADARLVRAAVDAVEGPCVVLGHSYGGLPITEGLVGANNLRHLVYLTAFMLPEGVSLFEACGAVDPPWWRRHGTYLTADQPRDVFYNSTNEVDTDNAVARLGTQSVSSFMEAVTQCAWRETPSTYIRCTNDQAIPLFAQDAMATNATTTHTLAADHSPFLSDRANLVTLLQQIVADA